MGRIYFASLKLALALVGVGVGILLLAHWANILPNAEDSNMRHRQDLVELTTTFIVDDISRNRWPAIRQRLQRVVDRQPELLTIGVRTRHGELTSSTGNHQNVWDSARSIQDEDAARRVGNTADDAIDAIEVSIAIEGNAWGQIEFAFIKADVVGQGWFAKPLIQLIFFFTLLGTAIYACFVFWMVGIFQQTQVVPDHVRGALDTLAEGLLMLDPQGRIMFANRAFSKSVDQPSRRLEGAVVDSLDWQYHLDENQATVCDVQANSPANRPWQTSLRSGEPSQGTMLRLGDENESATVFSINVTPLHQGGSSNLRNRSRGALVTFRDVTSDQRHKNELREMLRLLSHSRDEIAQKNERLEILATRDALTKCLNRRAFFERFENYWTTHPTPDEFLSCIMIDIDHFKSVNDTYGHHAGDEVLRAVAAVLRELHEDNGVVCRYGGEEFCVLFPDKDVEQAFVEAEKTRVAISKIVFDDPSELRLTASLGVSERRFDAADPQSLINQADECLYVAKREGRNRVIAYNPSISSVSDATDEVNTSNEFLVVPPVAINALVRALSHCDPSVSQRCRRVANRALHWSDGQFDAAERYTLEVAALLHRVDRLATDQPELTFHQASADGQIKGIVDAVTIQQVIDSLEHPPLSRLIRDYLALSFASHHLTTETFVPQDSQASTRMRESQWLFAAVVFEFTSGAIAARHHATAQKCRGLIADDIVQQIAVYPPPSNVTRGIMTLQHHITESISSHITGLNRVVRSKDSAALGTALVNLQEFAYSLNLSQISDAVSEWGAQERGNPGGEDWSKVAAEVLALQNTCRDVQQELLTYSIHHPQYVGSDKIRSQDLQKSV